MYKRQVRNSGTAIQWKYPAEEEWRDLVALSELRGASGENGKDGINGVDAVSYTHLSPVAAACIVCDKCDDEQLKSKTVVKELTA